MSHDRYYMQFIGRYKKERSDKIWGWFTYSTESNWRSIAKHATPVYCYAFWGKFGRTISYTRHDFERFGRYRIDRLANTKVINGYTQITTSSLEKSWSTVYEDLDITFVPFLLSCD
jgi:hypothetical protein